MASSCIASPNAKSVWVVTCGESHHLRECQLAASIVAYADRRSAYITFMCNLGAAIRESGWTMSEIAAALGVDVAQLSRWCAGRHLPRPATRQRICYLLGYEESELWPE